MSALLHTNADVFRRPDGRWSAYVQIIFPKEPHFLLAGEGATEPLALENLRERLQKFVECAEADNRALNDLFRL